MAQPGHSAGIRVETREGTVAGMRVVVAAMEVEVVAGTSERVRGNDGGCSASRAHSSARWGHLVVAVRLVDLCLSVPTAGDA